MKLNKKRADLAPDELLKIILIVAIVVAILSILLIWAKPAFGKTLEWFKFW